ncbi:Bidirectional sugar transporter SWEET [Quillaja saponaria]|uniref:Bidirectional sugar transporter SWEET n=1 Tax=Quillaja saponaria TaxID=32244 RepID=A0AAD7VJL6_QUISA|nr:Bidirectional sugar transporter SWEET [Quillaja saponaria]
MKFLSSHELALIFGLLGNIVSFMVFLAPIPTFYKIYKKKSSEGFQSMPYVIALLSAMLLLYYGLLKTNATLIITINAIGCAIEVTYLLLYIIFATRKDKIYSLGLILLFDVGAFGLVMVVTIFFLKGLNRVHAVGWICAAFNIAVFAAPLSIMRQVIKTRSVEYMPFSLSFFLTLCAIMWFFYGIFVKDYFIALPNVLGFLFGMVQMILYIIFKDSKKVSNQKCDVHHIWIATDSKLDSFDKGKKLQNGCADEARTNEMKMFACHTSRKSIEKIPRKSIENMA